MSYDTYPPQYDLTEIAARQRHLLWFVLLQLSVGCILGAVGEGAIILAVPLLIPQFIIIYRLARAVHVSPWIYMLGSIVPIPLVSLIVIVLLANRATTVLKNHGVKVGLMGAKGPIPQHTQDVSDVFR